MKKHSRNWYHAKYPKSYNRTSIIYPRKKKLQHPQTKEKIIYHCIVIHSLIKFHKKKKGNIIFYYNKSQCI